MSKKTTEYFGKENIFGQIIKNHLRLENYGEYGVQFNDWHDSRMLALFSDLFQELEERIEQFEKYGDIKPGYRYAPKYVINNRLTTLGKKELKPNGLD
nr:hypothetical protein [Lactiplantibacillus plantarum]